jgi:3-dehydroquinate synthase
VINDPAFLDTLEDRDWISGISEAVKVALLKDPEFFGFLSSHALALKNRESAPMQKLIHRCAELHLEHITTSGDPFEMGSSRPLDFGHWAAHKLEQLTGFDLRHGEAVAIGLALDVTYSMLKGMISEADQHRILDTLKNSGFRLWVPELQTRLDDPSHPDSLLQGLNEFREHLGGKLTIMLLEGIGEGVEVHEVDFDLYRQAVQHLEAFESVDHETIK